MLDRDKFFLVQSTDSQSGTKVYGEARELLAFICGPPTSGVLGCLMGCGTVAVTIVACVVTFFAVPIPAIWLFCRATGFSFDDPQQWIYYCFVVPGEEKVRTKSYLWSLDDQTGKPVQRIGKTEFDPDEEFTYAIFVAADPERTIDRRLIVALASLLEW